MKSLSGSPEQQKKVMPLVIACIVVFGFCGWRTMSALGGSGQPAPPDNGATPNGVKVTAGSQQTVSMDTAAAAGPPPTPKPEEMLIDPPHFVASETPNPFHRADGSTDLNPPIVRLPPQRIPPRNPRIRTALDNAGSSPIQPFSGSIGDQPKIKVEPDPAQQMEVLGVVTGQNPVAVIRVGTKQYVVEKGANFGGGLHLREVTVSRVVVEQGGEMHILRVGVHPAPAASTDPSGGSNTNPNPPQPIDKSGGIS